MKYAEFKKKISLFKLNQSQEAISENRKDIRIKKEKTIVKNLERIFEAALKIGNNKGFHAMSMRDLSEETGLSMGALYAYFTSKENLLVMLQKNGRSSFQKILENGVEPDISALDNLRNVIKTHLFMSEAKQPWFYFSYMESKNLNQKEKKIAVEFDMCTDEIISNILLQGEQEGIFKRQDHQLTAAMIKALMNDWYLRRWKYAKRNISVDNYADFLLNFVESLIISA